MPGFFSLFFWRLYKWLLRFLTRKCELLRICEGTMDLTSRTIAVGEKREREMGGIITSFLSISLYITANSLKSSRHKVTSTVTLTNLNISLPLLYMYMYIDCTYYFLSLSLLPVKGAPWYSSHYSS